MAKRMKKVFLINIVVDQNRLLHLASIFKKDNSFAFNNGF